MLIPVMMRTKYPISFAINVSSPTSILAEMLAMRPISVRSPVPMTTPRATPVYTSYSVIIAITTTATITTSSIIIIMIQIHKCLQGAPIML